MNLTSLDAHWIGYGLFTFKCPCCQKVWLCCKNCVMPHDEQFIHFQNAFGDQWNQLVVPMSPNAVWSMTSFSFERITVSPSIDASASGHWHGWIREGVCQ